MIINYISESFYSDVITSDYFVIFIETFGLKKSMRIFLM